MPEIDLSQFANIPVADLEAQRRALVAKANGNHDNLEEDDLCLLAAITGVLRRKASGPPKAVKEKGTRTKTPKVAASLDDLA